VTDLDSVIELKKKVKDLERDKERAQGRIDQLLKSLKNEFSCSNIETAKELLEEKQAEMKRLEKKYKIQYAAFMKKWGAKLEKTD